MNENQKGKLLLVEDEPLVQKNNKMILERRGYTIHQAYTLSEARAIVASEPVDAIILDLQLPDGNGLDFLNELRVNSNIPVLILTAMGTSKDIIKGLDAGGDDYLPKPYDLAVFLKRIEALMRRASSIPPEIKIGNIKLNVLSGQAFSNDKDMLLTQKEFALLMVFVQNEDNTISADNLYQKVWGTTYSSDKNALKKHISNLRSRLEDEETGYTIRAVYGEGYSFEKI